MMKTTGLKKLAGSALLATLLAAPMATLADHHKGQGEGLKEEHHERMLERMAERLELTEGQKAQLKVNHEANREQRMAQRQEMRQLRQQIREAIDSGADQATLDRLGAQLGQLQVSQMQDRHRRHQELESILTDEQKAKLEEMKSDRKARWRERHKGHHKGQSKDPAEAQ
ncbi:Spy/CpxP family protein refolding chaperone [Microbulbifer guangxiensis]|uniref:Spy/CpxP family protein refolding chaperone n=1 Tax=Microbulbifer guangxiensis TaxID=2904249 RepID=UPI001F00ACF0|nr:Spy/CpxP family protein refolding chaperone [Microbulbifer guangxiensis]